MPDRTKFHPTPRRGQRSRPRRIRYWLRRPEPSLVLASVFTVAPLVQAAVTRDWALLLITAPSAAAGVLIWRYRHGCRWNADRWQQGYPDAY